MLQRKSITPLAKAGLLLAIALIPLTLAAGASADEIDARDVVSRADLIRFPQEDFQVQVVITSSAPGQTPEVREYEILSKGNENTIVRTTAPPSERGQILLLRGRDLWVFMPNLSQPIRLPLAQRLTGQVANGDLARANFAGDYDPRVLRTEEVHGIPHHVLELSAVDRGVTYHRVVYWVEQGSYRPYKAEFYAVSGRLLKTAFYEDFRQMLGVDRPARLVMVDAVNDGDRSVLEYSGLELRELPDRMFHREYLRRLR
jgi:outer membrane lipoprotein-sorting protein